MLTCTRLIPRFCPNAHHHGSLPQQLGVVWDLLLKTDPEGPTLIFHAACPHDWSVHDELLSVCACSTLKPRKSKVSGRRSPAACRFRAANRPNSTSRVLPSWSDRPRLHPRRARVVVFETNFPMTSRRSRISRTPAIQAPKPAVT